LVGGRLHPTVVGFYQVFEALVCQVDPNRLGEIYLAAHLFFTDGGNRLHVRIRYLKAFNEGFPITYCWIKVKDSHFRHIHIHLRFLLGVSSFHDNFRDVNIEDRAENIVIIVDKQYLNSSRQDCLCLGEYVL